MDSPLISSEILVFINYRTSDEPFAALLLDRRLAERFGPGRIFRDSRTIQPGTRFPACIRKALQECRAMIVVIGERWLRSDAPGLRLIDDPEDWVRVEIAAALQRGIVVVPVLVGNATLPPASALPADIAGLVSHQYRSLRVRDADRDGSTLIEELIELLGTAGMRPPYPARSRPPRRAARPAVPRHASPTTSQVFQAAVDARNANFGNVYNAGSR